MVLLVGLLLLPVLSLTVKSKAHWTFQFCRFFSWETLKCCTDKLSNLVVEIDKGGKKAHEWWASFHLTLRWEQNGGKVRCGEVVMRLSALGLCTYLLIKLGNQIRAEDFILKSPAAGLFLDCMVEKWIEFALVNVRKKNKCSTYILLEVWRVALCVCVFAYVVTGTWDASLLMDSSWRRLISGVPGQLPPPRVPCVGWGWVRGSPSPSGHHKISHHQQRRLWVA